MNFPLTLGNWHELQTDAQAIRFEVFVKEQGVPIELEIDDMDPLCMHALVRNDTGEPIATGRLLPDGYIGRMAVKKQARGQGIGSRMLEALIAAAENRGDKTLALNAQLQAEAFYARFGFVREGGQFDDAGIPHVHMKRRMMDARSVATRESK